MLALLLLGRSAAAAELFFMDHDPFTNEYVGATGPLVLSGEIVPGDYDRLLSKIAEDENRFIGQNKLMLASEAGDVPETIKIAKLIKALYTEVVVGPLTGKCVGPCFLIYTAANLRGTDAEHLIGIDRPTIDDAELASGSPADAAEPAKAALQEDKVADLARAFMQENSVPGYLVDEMLKRSSSDVYWLTEHDEAALGTKSPAFAQFLLAKCAWDEKIEPEVYAGKRSIEDLKQMWTCRARFTVPAAHQALAAALKEKAAREANQAKLTASASPAASAKPAASHERSQPKPSADK